MATEEPFAGNSRPDGGAEPVVVGEPKTTFDERTQGITHPWQVGTDSDPRTTDTADSELVGTQETAGGVEDQGVATPVGDADLPEGHENPAPVNPDPAGVGVEAKGVSAEDQAKAQTEANAQSREGVDEKSATKNAKAANKARTADAKRADNVAGSRNPAS